MVKVGEDWWKFFHIFSPCCKALISMVLGVFGENGEDFYI
jgi:hypothetical protein